jgi:hypothetical protein
MSQDGEAERFNGLGRLAQSVGLRIHRPKGVPTFRPVPTYFLGGRKYPLAPCPTLISSTLLERLEQLERLELRLRRSGSRCSNLWGCRLEHHG